MGNKKVYIPLIKFILLLSLSMTIKVGLWCNKIQYLSVKDNYFKFKYRNVSAWGLGICLTLPYFILL
jgi:hypothetical protein